MSSRATRDFLNWPFFEARHSTLADHVEHWASANVARLVSGNHHDRAVVDNICKSLVSSLGESGLLRHCIPAKDQGGVVRIDSRALCLIRETLARHSALADFAFAMQGLGSSAISLDGSDAQREYYLPYVARGEKIAAFALSEPEAGSDVSSMTCCARREGDAYVLDGQKTWISNGGIADFYIVYAREPGSQRSKGISAFVIDAGTPGFEIAERIDVISPHPLATLQFTNCRIPASNLLGTEGKGFALAMRTLDIFRTSVAAAALGFSRKAMEVALERATSRKMFGTTLAGMQITQAAVADIAVDIDASALLIYRAAWMSDMGRTNSREAAMAKLVSTESAQRAARSGQGRTAMWRKRRAVGVGGREVVSRRPGTTHLRGRYGSPAPDYRQRRFQAAYRQLGPFGHTDRRRQWQDRSRVFAS